MFRIWVVLVCLLSTAAQADVPARVEAAFRAWVAEAGAGHAALTLWRGGEQVRQASIGGTSEKPMAIGSLSKAVTALCAADLMARGVWQAETTTRDVLGYGEPTLGQLLTHSTGLLPDQTQGLGMLGLLGREDAQEQVAERALLRPVQEGTPGTYAYNNENYMIIGAMIAAQTGQSYQAYCTQAVLSPAGVAGASPIPQMIGLLAAGGWQMPVDDYARLMHWGYGPDGVIGQAVATWPEAVIGGGAHYGMGMVQRPFRGSYNHWHFGLLCFPGRATAGAYAVQWEQDWLAVVAFDACVGWDQLFALDAVLSRAVYP